MKDKKMVLAVARGLEKLLYDDVFGVDKVNTIVLMVNDELRNENSKYLICPSAKYHTFLAITKNTP